ncbi:hypothetical protein SPAR10_1336 [Streptococcus infantis SPAR10]|uniref:Uncharacterized protein n=1 Tax=Streptococcus infantis SPAR10 TaxID=1159208 RepID=J1SDE2_9STRE|nr:hypothetical protein SPAR10_1336 [Streptococcus infantis SPAR10]
MNISFFYNGIFYKNKTVESNLLSFIISEHLNYFRKNATMTYYLTSK